ncbi:proline racemase family protein [Limobrevibacterium gyesilva]|uniref:Proline racemase family protein n=1 Tax=Limobrevibacterium gyesilva TaxID=2991712 RepID=A0AA41YMP9_9PROT|nr:proline racemase family protein [Limobrevibacterium gyesilva]MCW3474838.1 proline racemase family protein [Limobrevibacterium gyesilva]
MRTRRTITVVGCHAEGEIGDVVTGGLMPPPGATMFDKMRAMQRDHDDIRRFLLCEPRGHVGRHVNILTPPANPSCQAGVIIMEPTEYVPMSGSNLICTVTVLLETGIVAMQEPQTVVMVDTPAGPVRATATCRDGKCVSVEFENVPSFVDRLDAMLDVEGYGTIAADIAFGGMFYAIVDATRLGFAITPDEARDLAILGERIRTAARAQLDVAHPENPGIAGVSIVQLNRPFAGVGAATRNTCIVAPGRSDRSPTGTGTCARMAVLHARGQMRVGDGMVHESIIGSRFEGRILAETHIAGRTAILPAIRGRAWITGLHTYLLDPSDPYPEGYVVADTWGVSGAITQ